MVDIGQFNRRPLFENWTYMQDAGGGSLKVLIQSFYQWAKFENRSGYTVNQFAQDQWQYDAKVTVRYNADILSNTTLVYDSNRYKINSVSIVTEGSRRFQVLKCSFSGAVQNDEILLNSNVKILNYTGVGGETEWTDTDLIDKEIIGAFKDGLEFQVITEGVPTGKQVKFDDETGTLTWGIAYETGEHTLIQYQDVII